MSINAQELNDMVIRPVLNDLGESSQFAEHFLLKLALHKSECGEHLSGRGTSGGLGIYGISPKAHTELWDRYLTFQPDLASKVRGLASQRAFLNSPHAELTTNLAYASAVAWLISKYQCVQNSLNSAEYDETA